MSGRSIAFGLAVLSASGCAPVYSTPPSPSRPEPATDPALADVLGRLVWPLATDRASALTSDYGPRDRPGDGTRFHTGLDLQAPEGTPVYAAADGTVVRSEPSGAYGHMILLEHGAGTEMLYAHHARNLVARGDRVRRGEVIALVGHSGNATGDHLHFELRWRGGTVDPWTVLPALRSANAR